MQSSSLPLEYSDWRTEKAAREEDAAYSFGYYLILPCRDEEMATMSADAPQELKSAVGEAIDAAIHNVCALLEGFWPLDAGPKHRISLALNVQVHNAEKNEIVEKVEISPCKLDLPIGYWKWARDREFR